MESSDSSWPRAAPECMTAASSVTASTRETRFAFMITHNLLFAAGGTTLDHARGCQNHANAEGNDFGRFALRIRAIDGRSFESAQHRSGCGIGYGCAAAADDSTSPVSI